jgi:hypothetical protein
VTVQTVEGMEERMLQLFLDKFGVMPTKNDMAVMRLGLKVGQEALAEMLREVRR